MNQFDYLGHGLFGLLANRFDHLFYDGGSLSMAELEAGVRDEADVAAGHFAVGRRYLQDAKPVLAREALRQALQLNPSDASSRVAMACALSALGLVSEAIDELHSCLDEHPDNEPARIALAFCTQKLAVPDVVAGGRSLFELAGAN